jgi:hypothetical protein
VAIEVLPMATEGHLLRVWRWKHEALKENISLLQCTLGVHVLENCTRQSVEALLKKNQDEAKIYEEIIEKLEHRVS